jgi:16S rRNA G966 N2-methylase RsmD
MTTFYCGDCLDALRKHVKDELVDLIYIDPPFNKREWERIKKGN